MIIFHNFYTVYLKTGGFESPVGIKLIIILYRIIYFQKNFF